MKPLIASSLIAWTITATVSIWAFTDKQPNANRLSSEYAFHVIEQGLAGKNESDVQIEQIMNWKKKGWTAQTGAIKTLCNIDPERMEDIMDKKVAEKACRLIRTAEQLSILTPIES